jgi:hypothetical protein
MKTAACFCFVTLLVIAGVAPAVADQPLAKDSCKASTSNVPLALRNLNAASSQLLDQSEAARVRGQWWVTGEFPSGAFLFAGTKGTAPFVLRLTAESTSYPGDIVKLRYVIGR